jgi:hypothetical protein
MIVQETLAEVGVLKADDKGRMHELTIWVDKFLEDQHEHIVVEYKANNLVRSCCARTAWTL